MIVDTSVIMAILLSEPEADAFFEAIRAAADPAISAGTHIELSIVTSRRNPPIPGSLVDALLEDLGISIEPVTVGQANIARQAYLTFGRGNHPAALNFGDYFAYALAKAMDKPLLFKGEDFGRTDVRVAV
jgi:ribonuclease VapC